MKKIISLILLVFMLVGVGMVLTSCLDNDDCSICGGSGYYQKKFCPGCN